MTEQLIAYQGEPGANSHIACRTSIPDWTPLPCATFEDASRPSRGPAELGMIPIENSLAGRVADIHTLLPDSGLHHRRRIFPADPLPAAGVQGATLEG